MKVDKPTVRKSRGIWCTYLPGMKRKESLAWRDALKWVSRYYGAKK